MSFLRTDHYSEQRRYKVIPRKGSLSLLQFLSNRRAHVRHCSTESTAEETVATSSIHDVADVSPDSSSLSSYSYLDDVPMGPPDPILGIAAAFRSSTDERKVNVCVGAYRDENGKPWVLPSVREAERRMLDDPNENKEYLPIDGDATFVNVALKFAYGLDAPVDERIAGVQSLSGTGACRIGGQFLSKYMPVGTKVYLPNPTWGNHIPIFESSGLKVKHYRYFNYKTNKLDLDGMISDIQDAPDKSIILLHACAHNPTGCDPTKDQWKQIASICKERGHIVFFDSAYQGFASGDSENDAWAIRYFAFECNLPVLLAQSFAKNFGLYGERCGTFSVVCADTEQKDRIMSQIKRIIRPFYSSPPKHGSSIVRTILTDDALKDQYYKECNHMSQRIQGQRTALVKALKKAGSKHDWSHITEQIGMFAFTGMSSDMVERLTSEYEIYLTKDGRISLAGLNDSNIQYVANAVHDVTDGKSIVRE